MAKKKDDQVSEPYTGDPITSLDKDFFTDLTKDTGFVIAESGSLMTSRPKVRTPLYVINCVYGGGLPLGIIMEISGPPSSGKSTFSYQCMGNYQIDYPDGVPVIYDMESSMDNERLKVLGVDTSKVLRLPATSLEEAFSSMFKMFNKLEKVSEMVPGISTFQIYDTIAAGGTEKQHSKAAEGNNVFGAGSMMEAPRIIKQNLANVFPYLEKYPIYLGLLNQVFSQIGTYQTTVGSGGGFGLKHACQAHITFGTNKDVFEDGFLMGTESQIKLEKSKLSPKLMEIPCYIDATKGGRIDEVDSFVKYLIKGNVNIIKTGSWYSINDTINKMIEKYPQLGDAAGVDELRKNYRKNDMYAKIHEDTDLLKLLQVCLIDFIDGIYPMQRVVNDSYQKQLISECKYLQESTNIDKLKAGLGISDSTEDN